MGFPPVLPPEQTWLPLVELAVGEDLGAGDVTTALVVESGRQGSAIIEARQPLVVCGLEVAFAVFRKIEPQLQLRTLIRDGKRAEPGDILATVQGDLRAILTAERTALNFLMRMCGVASWTHRFVDAVEGTGVRIVDTRKTLPGWRSLDKYATEVGGATNHRVGLYDGILLKDNHVAIAGGAGLAVKTALADAPAHLRVCVEIESEAQAIEAVEAGADYLLLDNRTPAEMRAIAEQLADRAQLEVSGGVNLDNVREIAETGVHRISIGALTHSAPAADVALEIEDVVTKPGRGSA
ncbi:MAG: carboxylating nicotinate-nucleotide diphosphorylase [Deltaproteobacteria bacterium]|jgi:nicotinate-nucleotide pyrophosphorylase (carboxylating)|nr:carboxylating nicotinate-nucleotide diphosphorylase [Deltaproteobacteria bacterium]